MNTDSASNNPYSSKIKQYQSQLTSIQNKGKKTPELVKLEQKVNKLAIEVIASEPSTEETRNSVKELLTKIGKSKEKLAPKNNSKSEIKSSNTTEILINVLKDPNNNLDEGFHRTHNVAKNILLDQFKNKGKIGAIKRFFRNTDKFIQNAENDPNISKLSEQKLLKLSSRLAVASLSNKKLLIPKLIELVKVQTQGKKCSEYTEIKVLLSEFSHENLGERLLLVSRQVPPSDKMNKASQKHLKKALEKIKIQFYNISEIKILDLSLLEVDELKALNTHLNAIGSSQSVPEKSISAAQKILSQAAEKKLETATEKLDTHLTEFIAKEIARQDEYPTYEEFQNEFKLTEGQVEKCYDKVNKLENNYVFSKLEMDSKTKEAFEKAKSETSLTDKEKSLINAECERSKQKTHQSASDYFTLQRLSAN